MKEAAVQRRHNLYRDSIVLGNSDPSLHLLEENPSIDWAGEYGAQEEVDGAGEDGEGKGDSEEYQKRKRMKQVVSMIQAEGSPILSDESSMEVSGIGGIPEEDEEEEQEGGEEDSYAKASPDSQQDQCGSPSFKAPESPPILVNGSVLKEEETKQGQQDKETPSSSESTTESSSAVEEKDGGMQGEDSKSEVEEATQDQHPITKEEVTAVSEEVLPPPPPPEEIPPEDLEIDQGTATPESPPEATVKCPPPPHDDSGFQSPTTKGLKTEEEVAAPPSIETPQPAEGHPQVEETSVPAEPESAAKAIDSKTGDQ